MPDGGDPPCDRVRRALNEFLDLLARAVASELTSPTIPPNSRTDKLPLPVRQPEGDDE